MQKYLEIEEQIKRRILSGEFKIGEKLPKQEDLAREYHTSRVTISHVMNILKQQEMIKIRRGKGIFVRSHSFIRRRVDEPFRLTKVFSEQATSQVISFDIRECDEVEANKLHLVMNDKVYEIIRTRLVNDEPLEIEYTIMPEKIIPGINEKVLKGSIYEFIQNQLQLHFGDSERIFRADKADAYDIMYLKVYKETPIFEIEQIAYLKGGIPFEFSHTRFPYDKIELMIQTALEIIS